MDSGSILITGGAGYIGSHVNKLLTLNGMHTIVYDNLSRGNKESLKWGIFEQGCLSDILTLDKVIKKHNVNSVIHCAGYAYVGESIENPHIYYENNLLNSINLLKVMVENNVDKIIFHHPVQFMEFQLNSLF